MIYRRKYVAEQCGIVPFSGSFRKAVLKRILAKANFIFVSNDNGVPIGAIVFGLKTGKKVSTGDWPTHSVVVQPDIDNHIWLPISPRHAGTAPVE